MRLSKRDLEILAACVIAFGAFRPESCLTSAADISHFSVSELDRGEQLMESLTEEQIRAALADVEALCAGCAS